MAYDGAATGSDDPGRGYDYETPAEDLASVLDHLDLHDITLVAHSMGSGENATHGLYLTHREKVNADLLAFVEDCDAVLAA